MTTLTFDTLKFVHKLRDSGMPENQAEALAEAFVQISNEAELATRQDLRELELRLDAKISDIKFDIGIRS